MIKRVDKLVLLVVLGFVALALLKTTLEIAAQIAPFVAGVGIIYMISRLWSAGKLDFVKAWCVKQMAKPATEPAERK